MHSHRLLTFAKRFWNVRLIMTSLCAKLVLLAPAPNSISYGPVSNVFPMVHERLWHMALQTVFHMC